MSNQFFDTPFASCVPDASAIKQRERALDLRVEPEEWPVQTFHAMGSHMSVRLALTSSEALFPLQAAVSTFANAEARLSRFLPDSELSQLNAAAGNWRKVSPLLWSVLEAALAMARATDGLFDPTLLGAIQYVGYDQDFAAVSLRDGFSAVAPTKEAPPRGGNWRQIEMRPATREVLLPVGVGIDLGGIAKGMVAAQVVEQLRPLAPCLVDAGGDVVAGDAAPGWPGWPVGIALPSSVEQHWARAHDGEPGDDNVAVVWLQNATLATSGTDYRRWPHQGKMMHHILDPRSGLSAETNLISVTVLTSAAAQAEAWSKAAIILGSDDSYEALTARRMAALLIHDDGNVAVTPTLLPHLA